MNFINQCSHWYTITEIVVYSLNLCVSQLQDELLITVMNQFTVFKFIYIYTFINSPV